MKSIIYWCAALLLTGIYAGEVSAADQALGPGSNSRAVKPATSQIILASDGQISKQEARKIAMKKRDNLVRKINNRINRFEARKAQMIRTHNARRARMKADQKRLRDTMKRAHEAAKSVPASDPTDDATFDEQFAREMNRVINQQEAALAELDAAMQAELDEALGPAKTRMDELNARDAAQINRLDQDIEQLGS